MKKSDIEIYDEQEVNKHKRLLGILHDDDEKVLFSKTITKINKRESYQKRNIILTTKNLYNVCKDNWLKKIFCDCDHLVKRKIPLKKIKAVCYSELGNEFVLDVPDEFDYRITTSLKDEFMHKLLFALEKCGVKEIPFYFKEEVELHGYTTHRSQKEKGIVHNLTGDFDLMTFEKFRIFLEQKSQEKELTEEQTEMIIDGDKKITINHFDLLRMQGEGGFGKVFQVQKKTQKNFMP